MAAKDCLRVSDATTIVQRYRNVLAGGDGRRPYQLDNKVIVSVLCRLSRPAKKGSGSHSMPSNVDHSEPGTTPSVDPVGVDGRSSRTQIIPAADGIDGQQQSVD